MSDIYSEKITLRSKDVNMYRKLRTSRLFELLQEISIRHTEELGAGRAVTLDQGLLWVVTMQRAEIVRMPEFDEEITLISWPGDTMHVLFPRYYTIYDSKGDLLIRASAIWMLVDSNTRKYVFPQKYVININGVQTGDEIELPSPPVDIADVDFENVDSADGAKSNRQVIEFEVPFSYVDLNGHMNNTRYFDLVEDKIIDTDREKEIHSICTEYAAEICFKDKIKLNWHHVKDSYFICGTGAKRYFKMMIKYNE